MQNITQITFDNETNQVYINEPNYEVNDEIVNAICLCFHVKYSQTWKVWHQVDNCSKTKILLN